MTTNPTTHPDNRDHQPTRTAVIATVAMIAVLILVLLLAGIGRGSEASLDDIEPVGPTATLGPSPTIEPGIEPGVVPVGTGPGTGNGNGTGGTTAPPPTNPPPTNPPGEGGSGTGTTTLPPVTPEGPDGPPPPPDPCDAVLAAGEQLAIGPRPLALEGGAMSGELTLTNCTDTPVDWTAVTVPWVTLAHESGNLAPGSTSALGFDVSGDIDTGAFEFKIKVVDESGSTYIDVTGFHPIVGVDLLPEGLGLSGGAGVGGCNHQCIVSAKLTPNLFSPNLTLDVTTTVDADMEVWVSTEEPTYDDDVPSYPGQDPIAATFVSVTEWQTLLDPLEPATDYHIVVAATDDNGHTAYQAGTFRTVTPLDLPDELGTPEGCVQQCITTAALTATADPTKVAMHVATNTAATVDVWVSVDAPATNGGVPDASSMIHAGGSGGAIESWDVVLTGLAPDTLHHIAVRAVDPNGGTSWRAGTFHTDPPAPVDVQLTFLQVHVSDDGDDLPGDRGELAFAWAVGLDELGFRAEEKIHSGTTVQLGGSTTYLATDVSKFVPLARMAAYERDSDGIIEFGSCGYPTPQDFGQSKDCEHTWNVAGTGIMTVASLAGYPRCSDFGYDGDLADAACVEISTVHDGKDYAQFTGLVAYDIVG